MSRIEDDDMLKTQTPAAAGLIAGRYKVIRELGRGGMGEVLLVRDTLSGVQFALKRIPNDIVRNSSEMEDIRSTYSLVCKLSHPNIANYKFIERDPDTGAYYLLMEFVDGLSLDRWIRKNGPMKALRANRLLSELASALDYAHKNHVMHRDVKPANIIVATSGTAKLIDFGLAAQIKTSLTRVSLVDMRSNFAGTRPYMAPELWKGRRAVEATDQWALAATVYEALAGDPPWVSDDMQILGNCISSDAPERPDGVGVALWAVLERALAKEPGNRWPTCGELVAALTKREPPAGATGAALDAVPVAGMAANGVSKANKTSVARDVKTSVAGQGRKKGLGRTVAASETLGELHSRVLLKKYGDSVADKFVFAMIPAGSFTMGASRNDPYKFDTEVRREVVIKKTFEIMTTPVSQAFWQALMRDNPSYFLGADLPVERVSWQSAQAFIKKLNKMLLTDVYRLPTEAEWEYACRAGSKAPIYGPINEIAWTRRNSGGRSHPVGTKKPNAWGVYDMLGNVCEWCDDVFRDYSRYELPVYKKEYVVRGGGFDAGPNEARASWRGRLDPSGGYGLGFRLVRTVK